VTEKEIDARLKQRIRDRAERALAKAEATLDGLAERPADRGAAERWDEMRRASAPMPEKPRAQTIGEWNAEQAKKRRADRSFAERSSAKGYITKVVD
jgi:hypothetical protein